MGFSRQEYWSGLPFPSPRDLLNPGIESGSPALEAEALTSEPPEKPFLRLSRYKRYQPPTPSQPRLDIVSVSEASGLLTFYFLFCYHGMTQWEWQEKQVYPVVSPSHRFSQSLVIKRKLRIGQIVVGEVDLFSFLEHISQNELLNSSLILYRRLIDLGAISGMWWELSGGWEKTSKISERDPVLVGFWGLCTLTWTTHSLRKDPSHRREAEHFLADPSCPFQLQLS